MRRPFTSAGFSPDMTLGELEDLVGKLLKGRTSVLPLDLYRELTGLAQMDDWAEAVTLDLLSAFGWDSDGDGLWSPIRPQVTERPSGRGLWN